MTTILQDLNAAFNQLERDTTADFARQTLETNHRLHDLGLRYGVDGGSDVMLDCGEAVEIALWQLGYDGLHELRWALHREGLGSL
ncbi:MAG: hypothetical protein HC933_14780 [Pleurocapsa sp. SU_196_0]|nr:hypothetical protein [Pleurocapsa sp. SU_196_0]